MFTQENVRKMFMGLLVLFLSAFSSLSYADWGVGINVGGGGHFFYHYQDHPHFGLRVSVLPNRYSAIRVGRARYFYYDGLYYNRVNGGYVIVAPPLGAYVSVIPSDFQPVMINGVTYYTDNGIYYILTRYHGYRVVEAPAYLTQPVPPAQVEVVGVAPYPSAVWLRGHWAWRQGGYVWVHGHWR